MSLPSRMNGTIRVSPMCRMDRLVRNIKVKEGSQAFGSVSEHCIDATGVVSIGGKSIPVHTAYWGDMLVWEPDPGITVPEVRVARLPRRRK